MNRTFYVVRVGIGFIIALFGILATGISIIGMIDPVGAKMSDDNDPFGTPHTLGESVAITLFYLLITAFGVWLMSHKSKRVKSD